MVFTMSLKHLLRIFRLTSNNDGPLQWMVGAFYQDETVKHDRTVFYKELIGPFVDLIFSLLYQQL